MANVKAKVLKSLTHKGEQYEPGDEVTLSPQAARLYARNDYVKLDAEGKEKVAKVEDRQEKNSNAGPNAKK